MKHNIVKFLIILNTTIFMISLVVIYLRYYVFLEKFSITDEKTVSTQPPLITSSTLIASPKEDFLSSQQSSLSPTISTENVVVSETKIRKPRFVYFSSKAKKVALIGSFNDWTPQPMKKTGKNRWELVVEIPEGEYLYNFLVDGKIVLDPNNKNTALSPKGHKSSVIQLK